MHYVRLVVLGDAGVGKTSIIKQLIESQQVFLPAQHVRQDLKHSDQVNLNWLGKLNYHEQLLEETIEARRLASALANQMQAHAQLQLLLEQQQRCHQQQQQQSRKSSTCQPVSSNTAHNNNHLQQQQQQQQQVHPKILISTSQPLKQMVPPNKGGQPQPRASVGAITAQEQVRLAAIEAPLSEDLIKASSQQQLQLSANDSIDTDSNNTTIADAARVCGADSTAGSQARCSQDVSSSSSLLLLTTTNNQATSALDETSQQQPKRFLAPSTAEQIDAAGGGPNRVLPVSQSGSNCNNLSQIHPKNSCHTTQQLPSSSQARVSGSSSGNSISASINQFRRKSAVTAGASKQPTDGAAKTKLGALLRQHRPSLVLGGATTNSAGCSSKLGSNLSSALPMNGLTALQGSNKNNFKIKSSEEIQATGKQQQQLLLNNASGQSRSQSGNSNLLDQRRASSLSAVAIAASAAIHSHHLHNQQQQHKQQQQLLQQQQQQQQQLLQQQKQQQEMLAMNISHQLNLLQQLEHQFASIYHNRQLNSRCLSRAATQLASKIDNFIVNFISPFNQCLFELNIIDMPLIHSYQFPTNTLLEWSLYKGKSHLLTADAYLLVFDLTRPSTFQYIKTIRDKIFESRKMSTVPIYVIANKADLCPSLQPAIKARQTLSMQHCYQSSSYSSNNCHHSSSTNTSSSNHHSSGHTSYNSASYSYNWGRNTNHSKTTTGKKQPKTTKNRHQKNDTNNHYQQHDHRSSKAARRNCQMHSERNAVTGALHSLTNQFGHYFCHVPLSVITRRQNAQHDGSMTFAKSSQLQQQQQQHHRHLSPRKCSTATSLFHQSSQHQQQQQSTITTRWWRHLIGRPSSPSCDKTGCRVASCKSKRCHHRNSQTMSPADHMLSLSPCQQQPTTDSGQLSKRHRQQQQNNQATSADHWWRDSFNNLFRLRHSRRQSSGQAAINTAPPTNNTAGTSHNGALSLRISLASRRCVLNLCRQFRWRQRRARARHNHDSFTCRQYANLFTAAAATIATNQAAAQAANERSQQTAACYGPDLFAGLLAGSSANLATSAGLLGGLTGDVGGSASSASTQGKRRFHGLFGRLSSAGNSTGQTPTATSMPPCAGLTSGGAIASLLMGAQLSMASTSAHKIVSQCLVQDPSLFAASIGRGPNSQSSGIGAGHGGGGGGGGGGINGIMGNSVGNSNNANSSNNNIGNKIAPTTVTQNMYQFALTMAQQQQQQQQQIDEIYSGLSKQFQQQNQQQQHLGSSCASGSVSGLHAGSSFDAGVGSTSNVAGLTCTTPNRARRVSAAASRAASAFLMEAANGARRRKSSTASSVALWHTLASVARQREQQRQQLQHNYLHSFQQAGGGGGLNFNGAQMSLNGPIDKHRLSSVGTLGCEAQFLTVDMLRKLSLISAQSVQTNASERHLSRSASNKSQQSDTIIQEGDVIDCVDGSAAANEQPDIGPAASASCAPLATDEKNKIPKTSDNSPAQANTEEIICADNSDAPAMTKKSAITRTDSSQSQKKSTPWYRHIGRKWGRKSVTGVNNNKSDNNRQHESDTCEANELLCRPVLEDQMSASADGPETEMGQELATRTTLKVTTSATSEPPVAASGIEMPIGGGPQLESVAKSDERGMEIIISGEQREQKLDESPTPINVTMQRQQQQQQQQQQNSQAQLAPVSAGNNGDLPNNKLAMAAPSIRIVSPGSTMSLAQTSGSPQSADQLSNGSLCGSDVGSVSAHQAGKQVIGNLDISCDTNGPTSNMSSFGKLAQDLRIEATTTTTTTTAATTTTTTATTTTTTTTTNTTTAPTTVEKTTPPTIVAQGSANDDGLRDSLMIDDCAKSAAGSLNELGSGSQAVRAKAVHSRSNSIPDMSPICDSDNNNSSNNYNDNDNDNDNNDDEAQQIRCSSACDSHSGGPGRSGAGFGTARRRVSVSPLFNAAMSLMIPNRSNRSASITLGEASAGELSDHGAANSNVKLNDIATNRSFDEDANINNGSIQASKLSLLASELCLGRRLVKKQSGLNGALGSVGLGVGASKSVNQLTGYGLSGNEMLSGIGVGADAIIAATAGTAGLTGTAGQRMRAYVSSTVLNRQFLDTKEAACGGYNKNNKIAMYRQSFSAASPIKSRLGGAGHLLNKRSGNADQQQKYKNISGSGLFLNGQSLRMNFANAAASSGNATAAGGRNSGSKQTSTATGTGGNVMTSGEMGATENANVEQTLLSGDRQASSSLYDQAVIDGEAALAANMATAAAILAAQRKRLETLNKLLFPRFNRKQSGVHYPAPIFASQDLDPILKDLAQLVRKHWKCNYIECSAANNWHIQPILSELIRTLEFNGLLSEPSSDEQSDREQRNSGNRATKNKLHHQRAATAAQRNTATGSDTFAAASNETANLKQHDNDNELSQTNSPTANEAPNTNSAGGQDTAANNSDTTATPSGRMGALNGVKIKASALAKRLDLSRNRSASREVVTKTISNDEQLEKLARRASEAPSGVSSNQYDVVKQQLAPVGKNKRTLLTHLTGRRSSGAPSSADRNMLVSSSPVKQSHDRSKRKLSAPLTSNIFATSNSSNNKSTQKQRAERLVSSPLHLLECANRLHNDNKQKKQQPKRSSLTMMKLRFGPKQEIPNTNDSASSSSSISSSEASSSTDSAGKSSLSSSLSISTRCLNAMAAPQCTVMRATKHQTSSKSKQQQQLKSQMASNKLIVDVASPKKSLLINRANRNKQKELQKQLRKPAINKQKLDKINADREPLTKTQSSCYTSGSSIVGPEMNQATIGSAKPRLRLSSFSNGSTTSATTTTSAGKTIESSVCATIASSTNDQRTRRQQAPDVETSPEIFGATDRQQQLRRKPVGKQKTLDNNYSSVTSSDNNQDRLNKSRLVKQVSSDSAIQSPHRKMTKLKLQTKSSIQEEPLNESTMGNCSDRFVSTTLGKLTSGDSRKSVTPISDSSVVSPGEATSADNPVAMRKKFFFNIVQYK